MILIDLQAVAKVERWGMVDDGLWLPVLRICGCTSSARPRYDSYSNPRGTGMNWIRSWRISVVMTAVGLSDAMTQVVATFSVRLVEDIQYLTHTLKNKERHT